MLVLSLKNSISKLVIVFTWPVPLFEKIVLQSLKELQKCCILFGWIDSLKETPESDVSIIDLATFGFFHHFKKDRG